MMTCDCCGTQQEKLYYTWTQSYRWCAECYGLTKQKPQELTRDPLINVLNRRKPR